MKVEKDSFWIAFLSFIFLIAPGFLFFFYFFPDIFLNLEIIKLVLLSISFVAPFILINTACFMVFTGGGGLFVDVPVGIFLTEIIFAAVLFASYLLKFSFKTAFFCLVGLDFLVLAYIFFVSKKNKHNRL